MADSRNVKEAVIELQGVYKTFHQNKILVGLDLSVRHGETLVILGRSGIGKSVALRHIVGLMTPDQGSVRVFGKDLSTLGAVGLRNLRRRVGYLFQDGALLNWMTLGENVALPLRENRNGLGRGEILDRVHECLARVELDDAIDNYPNEISGGMRKRAGLARALVTGPEIVLYDEPTSGLDPISSSIIDQLINHLKQALEITQVVVTHDIASAYHIGDRLALLHGGSILSLGTPQEFQRTEDPAVVQFVQGLVEGPLSRQASSRTPPGARPPDSGVAPPNP